MDANEAMKEDWMRQRDRAVRAWRAWLLVAAAALGCSLRGLGAEPPPFAAAWSPARDQIPCADARPASACEAFAEAVPIWADYADHRPNLMFGFRSDFSVAGESAPVLRIAASTVYRVYVNGQFVGHGPVRAPHGCFRVDEWPLASVVRPGANALAVEVSNYQTLALHTPGFQPGFLQCEVVVGDRVLCASSRKTFRLLQLPRVQAVSKMSPQRTFNEYYRLGLDWDAWRTRDLPAGRRWGMPVPRAPVRLLPRLSPYPAFDVVRPVAFARTSFAFDAARPVVARRDFCERAEGLALYARDEARRISDVRVEAADSGVGELALGRGVVYDFGRVDSGFLGFTFDCAGPCKVYCYFDDILTDGIPDPVRRAGYGHAMCCVWEFTEAGRYSVETLEPYCARYVHVFARTGRATALGASIREYVNVRPYAAAFDCSDERLNRVFAAARHAAAQNTMDATMDCPQRERNSGPGDAHFTCGGYEALTGDYSIERLFFDNYAIPARYEGILPPLLPAFYPCDPPSTNEGHIPTYMTWFVLQLARYTQETGDVSFRDRLREKMLALVPYFRSHYNADGLLESLPWWVFIDWTKANDWTQDVSYPANLLWAEALDVLARLYGKPELAEEAARIRATVRAQSWSPSRGFYRDHAVRQADGSLTVLDDASEALQTFMLAFGGLDRRADRAFFGRVFDELGRGKAARAGVLPGNFWTAILLRLCVLSREGECRRACAELAGLVDMADRTGTLWESFPEIATYSCNHGFTSFAARLIQECALGVRDLNRQEKTVALAAPDNGLSHASGSIPTEQGPIRYSWRRRGDTVEETVGLPKGWRRK